MGPSSPIGLLCQVQNSWSQQLSNSTRFLRFDCSSRTYHYYFPRASASLAAMQSAGQRMIGEHDFRLETFFSGATGFVTFPPSETFVRWMWTMEWWSSQGGSTPSLLTVCCKRERRRYHLTSLAKYGQTVQDTNQRQNTSLEGNILLLNFELGVI